MTLCLSHQPPLFLTVAGLVLLFAPSPAAAQNSRSHLQDVSLDVSCRSVERTVLDFGINKFSRAPVVIDGVEYERFSIDDAGTIDMKGVGHPGLPAVCTSVLIPDASRMSARVVDAEYYDIEDVRVAPHRGAILRNVDPDTVKYEFGPIYEQNAIYPAEVVSLRDPYILHDVRGLVVEIHPLQYNPVTRTLRVHTKIVVEVFSAGPGSINIIDRDKAPRRSCFSFEQVYRNQFCNYGGGRSGLGKAVAPSEDGDMLVISHGPFMSAMLPFVNWKNTIGINTTMVDVGTIGNNVTAISNYITSVYNAGNLSYVLLVGDAAQVATPSYTGAESDPTYSAITPDMYPDIFIGRFSAETTAHVDTQVQRVLEYEQAGHSTSMGGWNAMGMGIASAEGAGIGHYGEADYTHQNLIRGELLAAGFNQVDQVYDPSATLTAVVNGLNAGRRCVHYTGHGYTYGWSTTGFDTTAINGLTNVGKLPFVQSVACLGGDFSGTTSFGEAWLRATYGGQPSGAIAAYCSSVNQSWDPPMYAQGNHSIGSKYGAVERFWMESNWSVGGCWYGGSCTMMDIMGAAGQDMFMTWHLFGDPSVRLIEEPPLTVSVVGGIPEWMYPGAAAEFTVRILDGLETYVPGSGTLYYRLNGGSYTQVPLTPVGGNLYECSLPHTRPGDVPEFYFSAQGNGGSTVLRPYDAPTTVFSFDLCFEEVVLEQAFDSNPGWSTQGQWAFGVPTGGGGQYGNPDPTGGHTGSTVYGYNLAGDYANDLPERHLTTPALDFSDVSGAELSFWRWLNVEQPAYDHAKLRISTNGTTFTDLWENTAEITDSSWTQVSYDISAIADGQPSVYLRWTMGITDSSWQYSGWNIDDLLVRGFDHDPSLWAEQYEISVSTGGSADLVLDAGIAHAGATYLIAGSLSGTDPGFNVSGVHVPLNIDNFTGLTLQLAGSPYLVGFVGTLDGLGAARATFDTVGPLGPAWVGQAASFAYAVLPVGATGFVSNPVTVRFEN
ncbi:MAG: C25 family cysteine peptidase [Planctomycetota bacterium]